MIVPAALVIDGVTFPLTVTPTSVHVAVVRPALESLQVVLAQFCYDAGTAARRDCFARGEDFVVPELSAVRMSAADPDAAGGLAQWREFAPGAAAVAPDDELYVVSASWVRVGAFAVPRSIMVRLTAELVALADGLRAGRLSFAPPPEPGRTPEPGRVQTADPATGTAPAGASGDLLRELEADAVALDRLDPEHVPHAGLPPEELDALTAAKRRTLLLGLRVAGLLTRAATEDDDLRRRLQAAGALTLASYVDAARDLHAYLRSPERRLVGCAPPVEDLLRADVSLDWFRGGVLPGPAGMSAHEWLARCEAEATRRRPSGPRSSRTYTRVAGAAVWLHVRCDLGPHLSLWRVVPAEPRAGA